MAIINENQFFTVLVEFEVPPQHQQELIDAICDQVEEHIKNETGFVSASFHASDDGRRVINYAQWQSKEDWIRSRASGDDKATAAIAVAIKHCGAKTARLDTVRVARVVENA